MSFDNAVDKKDTDTARKVSVFGVFLVQIRENTDQENSEYGHFSCSVIV